MLIETSQMCIVREVQLMLLMLIHRHLSSENLLNEMKFPCFSDIISHNGVLY